MLGVGEEAKLTVTLPKGATSTWTVESADEGVAAIDGDTLRAVGEGSVKITARTHNGKTNTQTITVRPAPDSVSFNRTELAMGAGEAYALKASLNEGSAGAMRYSAAGDCISVDASGRVTALSAGEGTVTVETYNGKTAVCHVTVNPAPTQLTLSTADGRDKYGVGEKVQLIFEADSPIAGVTYKSNNTRAAVVSADGVLTMKKAGKVTITATTYNKVTAKLTIQVQIAPRSVTLKVEKNLLGVGEETKLTVTLPKGATSTWTVESADEGVAVIDGDTLRAVGEGSVKITARTHNGKTSTQTVTVRPAPDSVSFNRTELAMGAGEAYILKASLNEGSAGAMYYSAAGDCISVDASGRVTALSAGEGTVTVETYNGKTAVCHVTVNPAPTQLALSTADGRDKYGVGEKVQLIFEADSPIAGVTYKSNNARTAAVSADGVLTMKKAGKVTITASTYNGISAKLTIQVQIAPKSVSLKVEKNVLGVGEETKLTVTLPKNSAGRYEISLTGDSVRLEGDRIVAVRPGDTCVSVRSYNGRSAQVNITVCPEPTWLKLSPEEGAIPVGGRIRFAVEMDAGAKSALRFECSDSGVALPSEDGTMLGVSIGEAWITAVTANGVSARALLRVCPLPERISLPALPEVAVGDKYQVVPETYPENSMGEYTYASSDPSVARIDARGVISGYGAGSAVITVTSGSCVATQILTVRSYNDLHPVRVVAHRGASGYYPENTLDAFRHAPDYGAKNVELDVRRTADGKLVVFHDASISVKGKSRRLDSMTYEQLKAVKPDICLLSEALQVIGECGLHAHVEIKDKNIEPEVAECVKQSGVYGDADYLCFDLNVLRTISAHDPDTDLTYLINKQDKLNYLMKNLDKFQDIKTVSIHKALLTPEIVRTLHLHGKKVIGWTADTESDVKRLKKLGVDCITSNYPDRVK